MYHDSSAIEKALKDSCGSDGKQYMDQSTIMQIKELVRQIARQLGAIDDHEMTCCGVTRAQCHTLLEIGRAKSISLGDLSRLLNLDHSTMSRTVNNLVVNGKVEREVDPSDRRYVTIKLSEEGIKDFEAIEEKMNQYYLHLFLAVPAEKHGQILESLQLLLKARQETKCC